jgi:hypothetical protein
VYWLTAVGYGAVGGAVVEAINFFGLMTALQQDRNEALRQRGQLPKLREQVDVFVGVVVALSRLGLGALAGFVFHEQISGPYAAVVVGAAAPAILKQLNTMPGVRTAIPASQAESEPGLAGTKATAERVEDAANGDRLKLKLPDPVTPRVKLANPTLEGLPLEAGSAE